MDAVTLTECDAINKTDMCVDVKHTHYVMS